MYVYTYKWQSDKGLFAQFRKHLLSRICKILEVHEKGVNDPVEK